MKKSLFILVFAAAVFAGCKDSASSPANQTANADATPKMQTASFTIDGMTCAESCAITIQNRLSGLDGVRKANVDFGKKTATVEFDSNKQTPESLAKTVEGIAGGMYKVSNVTSSADHAALFPKEKDKEKKKDKKADKKACSKDAKPACCMGKKSCHEGKM
jgi:copper chaperone CopZ